MRIAADMIGRGSTDLTVAQKSTETIMEEEIDTVKCLREHTHYTCRSRAHDVLCTKYADQLSIHGDEVTDSGHSRLSGQQVFVRGPSQQ